MLSIKTKSIIADRLGDLVGDVLYGVLMAATALLPRNGRDHVRTGASLRMLGALRDVTVNHMRLRFERAALIQSQMLDWLEPETFAWLDSTMRDGEVLWDVGANVGLYTLWCAKRFPNARIVAFEPNALTYPLLVRHVIANGFADRVTALPVASSGGEPEILSFRLNTLIPGLAANQLDVDGALPMLEGREAARYGVVAGAADRLASILALPEPQHLKLDVDGIEPQILAGASRLLASVRSVLVEDCLQPSLDALERPLLAAGLVEDPSFRQRGSGRNRIYRRPEP